MNHPSHPASPRWALLLTATLAILAAGLRAQQPAAPPARAGESGVLFSNVHVFTGAAALSPASNVLVVGNRIRTISTGPIATEGLGAITRIDGGGRTLTPGLRGAVSHCDGNTLVV